LCAHVLEGRQDNLRVQASCTHTQIPAAPARVFCSDSAKRLLRIASALFAAIRVRCSAESMLPSIFFRLQFAHFRANFDRGRCKVSVVEMQARPAGAATRGVGRRAITGGHMTTISLDLVCMRTGTTERHPRDYLHVRPIHTAGARAVYRTWDVGQGLAFSRELWTNRGCDDGRDGGDKTK